MMDRSGVSRVRGGLAALDTAGGDLLAWTAATDGNVADLEVSGSTVYAGGDFTPVGGQSRGGSRPWTEPRPPSYRSTPPWTRRSWGCSSRPPGCTSGASSTRSTVKPGPSWLPFDLATGNLTPGWQPKAGGTVNTLALSGDGNDVYIGGSFTTLNGSGSLPYLGAVNATTGANDPAFVPNAQYPIRTVEADPARGVRRRRRPRRAPRHLQPERHAPAADLPARRQCPGGRGRRRLGLGGGRLRRLLSSAAPGPGRRSSGRRPRSSGGKAGCEVSLVIGR